MKRATLTFGICFITLFSTAQTWAPIGAKWTYAAFNNTNGNISYREWICVGDTIVGVDSCRIIRRLGFPMDQDIVNQLITYEDGNRIYMYNIFSNQFTVLYDFNKNAGDTWITNVDSCDIVMTVDSTDTELINGNSLKVLYVTSNDPYVFSGKIIQHMGHLSRPFPNVVYYCRHCSDDWFVYNGLRCYEDSVFGYHSFNIAASCDDITSVNEENFSKTFTIFPNPSSGLLNIETTFSKKENISISLYNVIGTRLINIEQGPVVGTYNQQLNIESLPSSVYFLSIQTDNTTAIRKVVKE